MEGILVEIQIHCYLIQRGKPCALVPVQKKYLEKAIDHIKKKFQLSTYITKLSDGWVSIWIYKNDFMLDVIKSLPEKPKTTYDHWILGKAFGYSDEAIKEFLDTKFY